MRLLLALLTLLVAPLASAQDVEDAIEALEIDFAEATATRSRKASRVMELEAAALDALGYQASSLWDETRYASRDLFATTVGLVGTAQEIEALALTLPASSHAHLHVRAADLVRRTADLAAEGVTHVVSSDLRTAAAYRESSGDAAANVRVQEALAFLAGGRSWLNRPELVDGFYGEVLLVALETGTERAGRDLGRQCLAWCVDPSARGSARLAVQSWELHTRSEIARLDALGKRIRVAPTGTAQALSLVDQVDHALQLADDEEGRRYRAAVPVDRLRLTAAERAGPSRDLSLLESAFGAAGAVGHAATHPRQRGEARRVQGRLERVPLAWATARVEAPTRLDGAWRQPVGLGLAVHPRSWLQLEALGTWEIPVSGDLWTGRLEGRLGLEPGARPAWTWSRAVLRPVAGGGLVLGPEGGRGWTAGGGVQLQRVRRTWRSETRVRVAGLEATWALTRLEGQSWAGPRVALVWGRGAVPWPAPGPRRR